MNILRFFISGSFATCIALGGWHVSAAEEHGKSAITQMAEIMHRLKHYPSPQGKTELQLIVNASDSTKNERIIAAAMINMQHQVMPDDVSLLRKLLNDSATSQNERELADILLNFSHRPSRQDKDKLKAMMK